MMSAPKLPQAPKCHFVASLVLLLIFAVHHSEAASIRRQTADILPSTRSHPLDRQIAAFLSRAEKAERPRKLDVSSTRDYLKIIDGQVAVFRRCQDTNGAIIDPDMKIEWQYSTPCYALSVALLHASGHNTDPGLFESGVMAMDSSVNQMHEYRCAHNHGEFYLQPVMLAMDLFEPFVSKSKVEDWRRKIATIDPYKLHPDNLERKKVVYNHNVVALAGEALRIKSGVAAPTNFFGRHLAFHRQFLTDLGMYKDPNVPMVYDEFSRQFLAAILVEDTGSAKMLQADDSTFYRDRLWRGAWTSLFMQSPYGECPTGGRSAQHIWNEAQMCVTYEIFASQYARDNSSTAMQKARAFKRAAHLSLQSIKDWLRPDGSGYVVKNRFPWEARHGFERYSAQSQYNLLACWLMAVACLYADDNVPEGVAPADLGGFVVPMVEDFHKVFANVAGNYVEYDTSGQERYNPTGLLRVHLKGTLPQLGPSDGIVHKFDPKTKEDLGGENLCIGPAWKDAAGNWHRLADYSPTNPPLVRVLGESPEKVGFQVLYCGDFHGATRVQQTIWLDRSGVHVEDEVDGPGWMRIYYPMLVFDGAEEAQVDVGPRDAVIRLRDQAIRFSVTSPRSATIKRAGNRLDFRNGRAEALYAEFEGRKASYSIRPGTHSEDRQKDK